MPVHEFGALPGRRPVPGQTVLSAVRQLPLDARLVQPLLEDQPRCQINRCVALVSDVDATDALLGFTADAVVRSYKSRLGWTTVENMPRGAEDYWEAATLLARVVGLGMGGAVCDAEFHDPAAPRRVGLLMEHKRTCRGAQTRPTENGVQPVFSGTTDLAANVSADRFGPHLDLVHAGPCLIGFIARGGGTVAREGSYRYLDPLSDQTALNAAGEALPAWQIPDLELYYGDARTLLHEAPLAPQRGWRDHLRFFVAPKDPRVL